MPRKLTDDARGKGDRQANRNAISGLYDYRLRRRLELVDIEGVGRRAIPQIIKRVLLDDARFGDPKISS
jgi:hypothetical protein